MPVRPSLKWHHTFGCPVYALDNRLQQGQSIPRWDPRVRLGIYLGQSPRHARSVSLVLSTSTCLVSPQYHVKHDDFFETVNARTNGATAKWQAIAGFTKDNVTVEPLETNTRQHRPPSNQVNTPVAITPQDEVGNEIAEGENVQDQLHDVAVTEEERDYARAPSTVQTTQFNRQDNSEDVHAMRTRRVR